MNISRREGWESVCFLLRSYDMISLTADREVRLAFWISQVYYDGSDGSCGKRHSTENLGSKVGRREGERMGEDGRGWQWMGDFYYYNMITMKGPIELIYYFQHF